MYDTIAKIYNFMEEHSNAVIYYEKKLKIEEKILPSNDLQLATICNMIGLSYQWIGDYKKGTSVF